MEEHFKSGFHFIVIAARGGETNFPKLLLLMRPETEKH
jgi:hypothetical protein